MFCGLLSIHETTQNLKLSCYGFLDPAAWAGKAVASCIGPGRQRQTCGFAFTLGLDRVLFPLCFLSAAVFAQPTITKIEKMIGLVHDS